MKAMVQPSDLHKSALFCHILQEYIHKQKEIPEASKHIKLQVLSGKYNTGIIQWKLTSVI